MTYKDQTANNNTSTLIEIPSLSGVSTLKALFGKFFGFIVSSDIKSIGRRYNIKHARERQVKLDNAIGNNLPLSEKHRLGLYHLMK